MPIYFGSNFTKEPFQFDSVGNDWEQESVSRPNGFPLYHYLQTQEGVGEVSVYTHEYTLTDNSSTVHTSTLNSVSNVNSANTNSKITFELQKGEGILLSPNVAHSYCNKYTDRPWKTEFATFTGSLEPAFNTIFNEGSYENSYLLVSAEKGIALSGAIEKAVNHFSKQSNDTHTLSLDCYNIMLLLSDQTGYMRSETQPVWQKYIQPVISMIENQYMEDISAKELADSVFVSQQYLSRIFSDSMNCSVYEYLTNYRINKAKELLLINSKRKIQDIACDVGYSDSSHFIVMFKKMTGMTPVQFRKLHI